MNRKNSLITVGAIILSLFIVSGVWAQSYFSTCLNPGENPFAPMNIFLTGVTIDGQPLHAGDEIGLFSHRDRSICIGASVVQGEISAINPFEIVATRDDGNSCGFYDGDSIVFKIWQDTEGRLIEVGKDDVTFIDMATGVDIASGVVLYKGLESAAARINITINPVVVTRQLTTVLNPVGGGSINPTPGQYDYSDSAVVAVSATPNNGYTFSNWIGDVADPTDPNTTILMNDDKTLIANFVLDVPISTEWSDEIDVSAGAAPDLDIDAFGNLHIVSLNNGVIYTKMDQNGSILDQGNVPGTSGIPGELFFGVTVAADMNGNPHICYRTDAGNYYYNVYYIAKQGANWGTPLQIAGNVKRAYMVRMDIDSANRVHIIHGSSTGSSVIGPVKYYRIENGSIVDTQDNLTTYRADDRVEIDAGYSNQLHIIIGCPNPFGGPVSYWKSENSGAQIDFVGDIHYSGANDRNGSPDLFVDAGGTAHICYGAAKDNDLNSTPSVRYSRWENGSRVRDVAVTNQGDCIPWKQDQGIGSLASSANGQIVIVAYTHTDGGDLYTTMSQDAGTTWENREFIAANCGGSESRDKHLIRAKGNKFYLVYPTSGIKLRILNMGSTNDQLPVANAGGPYQGEAGIALTLDGSLSSDDIGIIDYTWDFGDGTTGSGVFVDHTYQTDNIYTARLTVMDSSGQTNSDEATVIIGNAFVDEWSDPIQVSSGDTPDFDIHKQSGDLHVVIMKDGVTYIKLDRFGNKIFEEVVPGTQNDYGMMNFGASIAVDSKGYPHIGYREARGNNYYDLYYTYKTAQGWTNPQKIGNYVLRGYVVRLAIDEQDRVYFGHSSVDNTSTNTGPVHMYIIKDGSVLLHQSNIYQTRGDERYEFDVSDNGMVDLVAGDLAYPSQGGPIYYWRSSSAGGQLTYKGDFHHPESRGGANGSPDVFVDDIGNTHVCYGAEKDVNINRLPSLHYLRFENGSKVRDVRVTDEGELLNWKFSLGIGSIASSANGGTVVAAYTKTIDGELRTRLSQDGGVTWSNPTKVSNGWHAAEMRNKHIIRANGNAFYLIYPENGVKLRIMGTPPSPGPALAITPTSVVMGNVLNEAQVTVRNSGSGVLSWDATQPSNPWITGVHPLSGDLGAGQSEIVTIYVDRSLVPDGQYDTVISFSSNAGNVDVPVNMQVGGPTAWYINCGGSAYTDNQGDEWQADQAYAPGGYGYIGGSTYSTQDPIQNTDSDPLYQTERYDMDQYRFDVPNGDYEVTLEFAEIYYTYLGKRVFSVDIEGATVLDRLDIYKVAGHDGAVSYTFSTRDSGIPVTDNNLVIGFSNISDVAKISAIKVEKLAPRGPILSIVPAVLDFGKTAQLDTFRVSNSGEDTLTWSLDSGYESWITSVQPQGGSLTAGESMDVIVTIDRIGLTEGTYSETLGITSDGGNKVVNLTMEVYIPKPQLAIPQPLLEFGNFIDQMSGYIKNTGEIDLTYTIDGSGLPGWITHITPDQGMIAPDDSASVLFQIDRNGLSDGSYEADVAINSDGGNGSIHISMITGSVTSWRINCGGANYTDGSGDEWDADQAYSPGGYGYVGGNIYQTLNPINGTEDDVIYQTERYGMQSYRFDVPNGDYMITLHFAEIYYSASYKRSINVMLEGDPILSGYDIYKEAPGKNEANSRVFSTRDLGLSIMDNRIDLDFSANIDMAKISGIEIEPLQPLGPELTITPNSIDLGRMQDLDTLVVSNTGENPLNWQLDSVQPSWIASVNPSNGILNTGGSQSVIVQVDRDSLVEGNYNHVLQFNSNGGAVNIPVQMEVRLPGPELELNPLSLEYNSYVSTQLFEVQNRGDAPLNWAVSDSGKPAWIGQIQPNSGQLAALQSVQVSVTVNRLGLTNGTYTGILKIASDGGNKYLAIEMKVGNIDGWRVNCGGSDYTDNQSKKWIADQEYVAGSYGFVGGKIYSVTDPINGTDDDVLYQSERYGMEGYKFDVPNGDYSITLHFAEIYYKSSNRRKINVSLEGTNIVNQLDVFNQTGHDVALPMSFNTSDLGLTIEDNRIDLEFSATKDMAKISAIEVSPVLPPGPTVVVHPNTLQFPRGVDQDTLILTNAGDGTLVWQKGVMTTTWVSSITPDHGTLNSQQSILVFVDVDRNGLPEGDYSGVIPIVTNGGNQNIPVNMEVRLPGPELAVNTTSLNFGNFKSNLSFVISNVGDDTLHWDIPDSARAAWVNSIQPSNASLLPGGNQTIVVGISRSNQSNGTFVSDIFIKSDGGNETVRLSYESGEFKINCGGEQVVDGYGKTWRADQAYVAGSYGYVGGSAYSTSDPINNTTIDPIYQSEHYNMSEYRIDLPNQDYLITLHFAEIYHIANGKRVMSVKIEGRQVLTDLDIYSEVGHDAALSYSFSTKALGISINDNVLDISFSQKSDVAKISGIEISPDAPVGPQLYVNPGELNFGNLQETQKLFIKNSGDSLLYWNITTQGLAPWIQSVSKTEGLLMGNQQDSVVITVSRSGLADGDYYDVIHIVSTGGNKDIITNLQVGGSMVWRINCGGNDYTDNQGEEWSADQVYDGNDYGFIGGNSYSTGDAIRNTEMDPLYQSERYGMTGYRFNVPNGHYEITLHFAEIYFTAVGKRQFNVKLENVPVMRNLDIFDVVGHDFALTFTVNTQSAGIQIIDGTIDLTFDKIADEPKISAIEVEMISPLANDQSMTADAASAFYVPTEYKLWQNYPNPFNNSTSLTFDLPEDANVRIELFNILGQHVVTLLNERKAIGTHRIRWNGLDKYGDSVPSGVYICYIRTNAFNSHIKMMYLK